MRLSNQLRITVMSSRLGWAFTLIGTALWAAVVVGCADGNRGCEQIKRVAFLFDGGSVVFHLPNINLSHRHLMVSPVRDIDPLTGEIQEAHGVKVFLVRESTERFYDEIPLQQQSAEEKIVLDYLLECQKHFAQGNDPWADKLDALVKLIRNRNSAPPPVYLWE
jgi:hypothetical protein